MNFIFNFGFIALIGAGLHRYVISQGAGTKYFDLFSVQHNEVIAYAIAIAWGALAIWNLLLRWKCPKCRSKHYSLLSVEEKDRWVGTKNVNEKLSNGSSTTRAVSTTFVKLKKTYGCDGHACDYCWSVMVKEEKT